MRLFALFVLSPLLGIAQEDFHIELTASAWRTSVEGTLQAVGLPVDLQSDLALQDRTTFFGRLVLKPGRRHRLIVEGAPHSYDGRNAIARTIVYNGATFNLRDTIESSADLTYVFGGYQFDFVTAPRAHLGALVGGNYLDATGTLRSAATGITATRNQTIGLPLAGAEFRVRPLRHVSVSGGIKGMALGGYGHFVQGEINAGIGVRFVTLQAGYQILDADIHENSSAPGRSGIAPRISGPIFGVQLRR